MKKFLILSILLISSVGFCQLVDSDYKDYTKLVNPFIGTGGHGHTYPGSAFPFGFMQLSPDSRKEGWDGCGGYHDSDSTLYGFSHTHLSGTGVPDYADLLFLPFVGETVTEKVAFDKTKTKAYAGFFKTNLSKDNINVELSTTAHCGHHNYIFDTEKEGKRQLKVDLRYRDKLKDVAFEKVDDYTIQGKRISKAWAEEQHFYFYFKTKQKIVSIDFYNNLYHINFGKEIDSLEIKVGISAVDINGAIKNLNQEINHWSILKTKAENKTAWNKELSKIQVSNFDSEHDTIFYTALYHSYLNPNIFSDVDGRYRGMDNKIYTDKNHTQYTVFSLWDTFRATHPLFTLTQRDKTVDFIKTFLNQYKQGGKLPIWELAGNYTGCMIGYHAIPVIIDAYNKGIRNFDAELALEAMVAIAKADELGKHTYAKNGVLEQGDEPESVSKQLEYAYDDWCIAVFADSLGESEIANEFYYRALTYRNSFNAQNQFMQPRINGGFASNFKPKEVTFSFTEANSFQYSLFAPQDIAGLTKLLGGRKGLENWLDKLFTTSSDLEGRHQSDITGLIGQYAHGNEPSHHMAYLYNYTDAPHKANYYVNKILTEQYWNAPDGLSGNEDCGQMSSWYVLSALGMYSVTPGKSYFDLSAPIVKSADLSLENGNHFVVETKNRSKQNIYVQEILLNGSAFNQLYIETETILKGGNLTFVFGSEPSNSLVAYKKANSQINDKQFVSIPTFSVDKRSFTKPFEVTLSNTNKDTIVYFFNNEGGESIQKVFNSEEPIVVSETCQISAIALKNGLKSKTVRASYAKIDNRYSVEIIGNYDNQYNGGGPRAVIDGVEGKNNYKTGEFQGFQGQDVTFIIDLKKKKKIKSVEVGILRDINSWIFFPKTVEVRFYKKNLDKFRTREARSIMDNAEEDYHNPKKRNMKFSFGKKVRYIKVTLKNYGQCPDWHLGAGGDTWIFVDEIKIK